MKNSRFVIYGLMFLIGLLLFLWWATHRVKKNDHGQTSDSITNTTEADLPNADTSYPVSRKYSPVLASNIVAAVVTKSKEQQARETLSILNDVDIVFYGRVQDQFGNALGRTEIIFSIQREDGTFTGVENGRIESDSNGNFTVSGYKGQSLSVVPKKAGYVLASNNSGAIYSKMWPEAERFHPDRNSPVIIIMRKLQGAENLIHFAIQTFVRRDGIPTAFDLKTGQIVQSGGDIIMSIESPSKPETMQKYDWKVSVQSADGGLILQSGVGFEQMFQAPESGYEPEWTGGFTKDGNSWSSRYNGSFYFKSRSGQFYGKMGLAITTDLVRNDAIPVTLGGYLNPKGSRNLELDPTLVSEARP